MHAYLNSYVLWDDLLSKIKHKKPHKKNPKDILRKVHLLSKKLRLYIHGDAKLKKTESLLNSIFGIACDVGVDTRKLCEKSITIMKKKGHDYSNGNLIINNFLEYTKHNLSPRVVWFVFILKHLEAVKTYLSSGLLRSEKIDERFCDVINYIILGHVILVYLDNTKY